MYAAPSTMYAFNGFTPSPRSRFITDSRRSVGAAPTPRSVSRGPAVSYARNSSAALLPTALPHTYTQARSSQAQHALVSAPLGPPGSSRTPRGITPSRLNVDGSFAGKASRLRPSAESRGTSAPPTTRSTSRPQVAGLKERPRFSTAGASAASRLSIAVDMSSTTMASDPRQAATPRTKQVSPAHATRMTGGASKHVPQLQLSRSRTMPGMLSPAAIAALQIDTSNSARRSVTPAVRATAASERAVSRSQSTGHLRGKQSVGSGPLKTSTAGGLAAALANAVAVVSAGKARAAPEAALPAMKPRFSLSRPGRPGTQSPSASSRGPALSSFGGGDVFLPVLRPDSVRGSRAGLSVTNSRQAATLASANAASVVRQQTMHASSPTETTAQHSSTAPTASQPAGTGPTGIVAAVQLGDKSRPSSASSVMGSRKALQAGGPTVTVSALNALMAKAPPTHAAHAEGEIMAAEQPNDAELAFGRFVGGPAPDVAALLQHQRPHTVAWSSSRPSSAHAHSAAKRLWIDPSGGINVETTGSRTGTFLTSVAPQESVDAAARVVWRRPQALEPAAGAQVKSPVVEARSGQTAATTNSPAFARAMPLQAANVPPGLASTTLTSSKLGAVVITGAPVALRPATSAAHVVRGDGAAASSAGTVAIKPGTPQQNERTTAAVARPATQPPHEPLTARAAAVANSRPTSARPRPTTAVPHTDMKGGAEANADVLGMLSDLDAPAGGELSEAQRRALQRERELQARQRLKAYVSDPHFDNHATADFYGFGKVLGTGSFGEVRLAWHRLAAAKVAIKSYEKARLTDPSHWKRVQQEIDVLSRLNHVNVLRMLETIDTPKRVHIVTDYCSGGNLCTYVKGKGRLSEQEARGVFIQLVSGIDYLHSNGVIHRDLKLENILFTDEARGVVRIVDFGFAVIVKDAWKKLRIFCGTPSYMAPEICQRREYVGKPVDVWSLGVLLYAMIVGRFPFSGKTYPDLYKRIIAGQLAFPDHVSGAARDLIRRMLNVDATRRLTLAMTASHPWVLPAVPMGIGSGAASLSVLGGGAGPVIAPDKSLLTSADPANDIFEHVLQRCEQLGFSRALVIAGILGRERNACTTTYYLVLSRLGRGPSMPSRVSHTDGHAATTMPHMGHGAPAETRGRAGTAGGAAGIGAGTHTRPSSALPAARPAQRSFPPMLASARGETTLHTAPSLSIITGSELASARGAAGSAFASPSAKHRDVESSTAGDGASGSGGILEGARAAATVASPAIGSPTLGARPAGMFAESGSSWLPDSAHAGTAATTSPSRRADGTFALALPSSQPMPMGARRRPTSASAVRRAPNVAALPA